MAIERLKNIFLKKKYFQTTSLHTLIDIREMIISQVNVPFNAIIHSNICFRVYLNNTGNQHRNLQQLPETMTCLSYKYARKTREGFEK